jgi:hypothetical protein
MERLGAKCRKITNFKKIAKVPLPTDDACVMLDNDHAVVDHLLQLAKQHLQARACFTAIACATPVTV